MVNLKRKKTNIERFGVDSFAKIQVFEKKTEEVKKIAKEKALITYQSKYGVDHFSKTQEYLDKRKNTVMEKYGVKNALELVNPDNQTPWFTTEKGKEYLENRPPLTEDKKQQIWYSRMLNSGIVKDPVLIDIISSKNSVRFKDYIDNLATTITEPDRISLSKKLGFSVSWLNMLFRRHGMQEDYNSAGYYGSSAGEKEVKRFIRELGFEVNSSNRGVLGSGFEIDILVKEKNLAIEYNGVIWHSEGKTGRDKSYHLKKTDRCEELGIQLLHIYDVE